MLTFSDNLLFILINYINLYFITVNVKFIHFYRGLCQERGDCRELQSWTGTARKLEGKEAIRIY